MEERKVILAPEPSWLALAKDLPATFIVASRGDTGLSYPSFPQSWDSVPCHTDPLAVGVLPVPGGESRGSWSVGRLCLFALLRGWGFMRVGGHIPQQG